MSSPLSRATTRVIYGASQLPRIAWYVGHSLAVRRLSETAPRRDDNEARPRAHTNLPVPDRKLINEQRESGIVYKCPPGQHDDLGVSLAMLAWAAQHIHLNAWQRPTFDAHRPRKQRKEYGWSAFV